MPLIFSVYFTIHLKITQHRAKENLEKSLLQTIILKEKDFTWVKKGKEIRIGNHLFDVESIRKENEKFIITGLYDEQEDYLHRQLNELQQKQDHTRQNKLCNFFFHLYYAVTPPEDDEASFAPSKTRYTHYFSMRLPSPFSAIFLPPPNTNLI